MCNIVWNPCGNTMQEWTFFCFVDFAYKDQLANCITFCRMDQHTVGRSTLLGIILFDKKIYLL